MSYFREANRPKRGYGESEDEGGASGSDDDETEEDEPWTEGRRRPRAPVQHSILHGANMDDLVFGNRSWLPPQRPHQQRAIVSKKQRPNGASKRYFFNQGVGVSSIVDDQVALRQTALAMLNGDDRDLDDDPDNDIHEGDDAPDTASVV